MSTDPLDEELQLALALSASEAEASRTVPPAEAPRSAHQGYLPRPSSGSPVPGLVQNLTSRLAHGVKRFLRPPSTAEQPEPTATIEQQYSWIQGGAPAAAGACGPSQSERLPAATTLASDEALARALQEQFDREQQQQQQQPQWQPPPQLPPGPAPAPLPPLRTNPSPAVPGPGSTASRFDAVPPPRPAGVPAAPPVYNAGAPAPRAGSCAGCGQPLVSFTSVFGVGGRYLNAMGRTWHPGCFKCHACSLPLAGGNGSMAFTVGSEDGLPYHSECHRQRFHPRCRVCSCYLPTEGDARIVWSEVPFWKDKHCPMHNQDGTKRCTGCTRLHPRGEQWVDLDDGRCLCLECLNTLVADTADCQPLYDDVLGFYVRMGMQLPVRPPMMLVESGALNQAEQSETHGQGRSGPMFHTRGLCLTEEYTSLRTVMRVPSGRGGGGLLGLLPGGFSLQPHTVQVGPTRTQVTAILVLYGLPRLLTGSILAHEAMHAWLRLSGYRGLAPEVEEGLCQLMALLWLEAQQPQQGSYEERLSSFLANQIRTDPSPVYGDGFRAALEAFQRFGLQTVLSHLRQTGRLPS